jgi:acyl-homoserine lactone acylase PvdQ
MLLSNSHLQWGDRHTYFEVQLTAPGVDSSGAVWVGFPVLRQCFNDVLGWTQTTNNPCMSDLFGCVLWECLALTSIVWRLDDGYM